MNLAAQSKTRPLRTLFDGSAVLNGGVFRRCSTYGKLFGLRSYQEQIVSDRCRLAGHQRTLRQWFVSGITVTDYGRVSPAIPNSTQPASAATTGLAQMQMVSLTAPAILPNCPMPAGVHTA